MTSTSPDLPRPNRRGFSRDAYDVAYNHHEAAKTSSRRRTAPSTPIACLQSVRCHRSNHARPRLHPSNIRQARPRRACNCTERDRQGDRGRHYQDHGCRPAVAGRRGQIRATGSEPVQGFLERVSHAPDGQSAKTGLSLTVPRYCISNGASQYRLALAYLSITFVHPPDPTFAPAAFEI